MKNRENYCKTVAHDIATLPPKERLVAFKKEMQLFTREMTEQLQKAGVNEIEP